MNPSTFPSDAPSILGFIWANRKKWLPGVGMSCLRSLVIAPFPLLFQIIVDHCLPAADSQSVFHIGLLFIGLLMMHYVFSVAGAEMLARAISRQLLELRSRIFFKIQYMSFGFLDQQKTGRLLSKYAFDTQKIEQTLIWMMNNFLPNLLYSAGVLAIMIYLNWILALVLLALVPVYAVCKLYFFNRLQSSNKEARLAHEKMTGAANEYISALRLVRSLGEEKQVQNTLETSSERVAASRVNMVSVNSIFGTFTFVSTQLLTFVVMGGGALLVIHGHLSIGTLFAFLTGLPILLAPIQMFTQFSEQYFVGQEAYRSAKELLDSQYVEDWKGRAKLPAISGDIRFNQVTFQYPSSSRNILENFNLHIHPGEKIAFVGPSGSGKSTIANLVLGLYRPNSGTILIDGCPQENMNMRWFRQQTALVMQESILLSGTIADNIRFGKISATDEAVRQAARLANAEEFILNQPKGYNTIVGERGAMLSGGQRQRISIARAILRDPALLILDEPTSALDYESEKLIQEALERLAHGRTVITIAHRLSTIRNCDRIIVLRQGEIVQQGNFLHLSSEPGYFAELLQNQGHTSQAAA